MQINKIYIATHRYDLRKTNICIASVRFWYPDIPIYLIKDVENGCFDTRYLEKLNVFTYKKGIGKWGSGLGKLLPLFEDNRESFLVLDADTVFYGEVLKTPGQIDADFIVDKEFHIDFKGPGVYYDLEYVRQFIPDFKFPGYTFNTGQWFGCSGILKKDDFSPWLSWCSNVCIEDNNLTKTKDQGVLNLVIHLKEGAGKIRVEKIPLMFWPGSGERKIFDIEKIRQKSVEEPLIIHWAGIKEYQMVKYQYSEILKFYEDHFFSLYSRKEIQTLKLKYLLLEFEQKIKIFFRLLPMSLKNKAGMVLKWIFNR